MAARARWTRAVTAAVTAAVIAGCGGQDRAIVGQSAGEEVGELTLRSDDSTAAVKALCVSDVPDDLTTCPGAPEHLGEVELNRTRTATLLVPQEVAAGGYRVRVNGEPLARHDGVLDDLNQVLRIPVEIVQEPGATVLTVEALFSPQHPRTLWQFVLSDPAGPPN